MRRNIKFILASNKGLLMCKMPQTLMIMIRIRNLYRAKTINNIQKRFT